MQLLGSQNDMATIRLVVYRRFVSIIIGNCASTARAGPVRGRSRTAKLCELRDEPYRFSFIIDWTWLSSMVSDLEAFSHNPTDGSFTALAFQPTVFTNYLIQRFLSY